MGGGVSIPVPLSDVRQEDLKAKYAKFIEEGLSEEDINTKLTKAMPGLVVFDQIDCDHTGKVSSRELKRTLRALPRKKPTPPEGGWPDGKPPPFVPFDAMYETLDRFVIGHCTATTDFRRLESTSCCTLCLLLVFRHCLPPTSTSFQCLQLVFKIFIPPPPSTAMATARFLLMSGSTTCRNSLAWSQPLTVPSIRPRVNSRTTSALRTVSPNWWPRATTRRTRRRPRSSPFVRAWARPRRRPRRRRPQRRRLRRRCPRRRRPRRRRLRRRRLQRRRLQRRRPRRRRLSGDSKVTEGV
mmetsp:Transcript_97569/g.279004  ORF Transcript_97569/g.279004 Transcript_97569/m.279004 type:complete len:297 (+) Transcript_97569:164-1054(+)